MNIKFLKACDVKFYINLYVTYVNRLIMSFCNMALSRVKTHSLLLDSIYLSMKHLILAVLQLSVNNASNILYILFLFSIANRPVLLHKRITLMTCLYFASHKLIYCKYDLPYLFCGDSMEMIFLSFHFIYEFI